MKFFFATLCFILLCFCSGSKRPSSIFEQPQDLLPIAFLADAFENVPNEILQYILDFLPFKCQLSLSSVNSFWSKKLIFLREANLEHSRDVFLRIAIPHSKVPFQKLLQVIDCFTDYWKSLCRNSRDANFLNQRSILESRLANWLFANTNGNEIKSIEWNTPLNQEGDTLSYILIQRLLLSPFFLLTVTHPIWDATEYETRIRASHDFLLQVPIILGKALFCYLSRDEGTIRRLWRVAIKRGVETAVIGCGNGLLCRNVLLQQLILLKDIRDDVRYLGHIRIQDHVLKLESIILAAVEAGSIDTFKDGFVGKAIMPNNVNYNIMKEKLISDGFELAYICPYEGKETYNMSVLSYVNMKNPAFLPFPFLKILNSQTPNQPQILMYLCSSIPNDFDFHQINVGAVVSILWPIVSKSSLQMTLEIFNQMDIEDQIRVFKDIIKIEIDRLVSSWRAESVEESQVCFDRELKNAALFFNTASPGFPFIYRPALPILPILPTFTWQKSIGNNIGLYFLTKIGVFDDSESSPIFCGRTILPGNFEPTFPPCQPRKLILPNGAEISIFSQVTHEERVRFDEEGSDTDESSSDTDESSSDESYNYE